MSLYAMKMLPPRTCSIINSISSQHDMRGKTFSKVSYLEIQDQRLSITSKAAAFRMHFYRF